MPGRWTINVEEGEHKRDIELVLEAGAEITGVVRFLDGAPASGVKLNARLDMAALGGPAAMTAAGTQDGSARTNAEGRFTMDGLGELAYVVRAETEIEGGEHVGSWSAIQRGVNPGGEPLALVLEPRLDLRGLVTDLDEQPLSEFEVLATLQGSGGMLGLGVEREDARFDASEDGSFTLAGLSKGSWEIRVDAEGFALSGQQVALMPEAASAPPLLFTLTPAAKVAGRVIDQNGAPVPGARVEVVLDLGARISAAGSGGGPAVLCDQEGVFLLEDLDPGMLSIRALHDGYAASEDHALELASGQSLEDIELALRSGAIVTGEVLDQSGEPAEGRTVMVQSMPSYTTQHMMTSESGGEFRFENLEPGQWQLISMGNVFDNEAQSGDMAGMMGDMLIEILELEDGEELHVVLGALAEDPVRLSCQVLLDGEPVEGLIVSLAPEDGEGFSDLKMAFTDGEGMFSANLDHPGTYLTSVQRNNGGTQQTTVEFQVHVPEGVEEHATTIELPVGRITGRVTDDRGEPLPDCRVSLQVDGGIRHGSFLGGNYVESATDADGAYSLDWLRPGTYSVAAGGAALGGLLGDDPRAGRTMQSDIAVSEGQWLDGVDFQLGRPGELHGLVRRADGMPAVGATIFIRNADGGLMERFSFITTDTAGRFRYPGLSPGYYTASAKLGSESSQESSQAQVLSDAPGNVDILLEAGTLLLVSVIDNTGAEVRATVSVRDDDGHEWTGMSSFSELLESYGAGFSSNEQRVGPVPAGSYDIEVLTNDGRRGRKPITVSGQAERKVKVRLR